jgi:hypothetical protein
MDFVKAYHGTPACRAYIYSSKISEYRVILTSKNYPMYYTFSVEKKYKPLFTIEWIGVLSELLENLRIIASEWIVE